MDGRTLIASTLALSLAACGGGGSLTEEAGTTVTVVPDTSPSDSNAEDPTPLTAGVDYTALADFSSFDNWVCDNETILSLSGVALSPDSAITDNIGALQRTVSGNSVPTHRVGDFPNVGNPNRIDEFDHAYAVPLRLEAEQPNFSNASRVRTVAVSLDGVLFEPETAEVYNDDRSSEWRYEALTIGAAINTDLPGSLGYLGSDCNNAHVQPTGKYHYHGMPEELVADLLAERGRNANTPTMLLVGYAADGYPLYARYGYLDPADPESGIVVVQGSYELKVGSRPTGPGGSYDGTFTNDWEFVAGSGDLDECNGRYGVTPEYPSGIYHYYLTDDYPFVQRCVWGEPTSDAF